jgi:hypothetical protein
VPGWLHAFSPRENGLLAAGLAAWRRGWWKGWPGKLAVILLAAQFCWAARVLFVPFDSMSFDLVWIFYVPFTLIHLVLYAAPVAVLLPAWRRRRADGTFAEWSAVPADGRQFAAAFLVPYLVGLAVFLALFYGVMLPWDRWWLWDFGDAEHLRPDRRWTGIHFAITATYMATQVVLNALVCVWQCLRRATLTGAVGGYLGWTVLRDVLAMWVAFAAMMAPRFDWTEVLLTPFAWPTNLFAALVAHAHPVFAAVYYPVCWAACWWLWRTIGRASREQWTGGEAG